MTSFLKVTSIIFVGALVASCTQSSTPPSSSAPIKTLSVKRLPILFSSNPNVIDCASTIKVEAGACHVSKGSGQEITIAGKILAPGTTYNDGIVNIGSDGKIQYVGCPTTQHKAFMDKATVVACLNAVVSPGLINTHDHLTYDQSTPNPSFWGSTRYNNRSEWRFGTSTKPKIPYGTGTDIQVAWSELRQVMSGTTSITGSGGYKGFLRNLDRTDLQEWGTVPTTQTVDYVTFPLGGSQSNIQSTNCTNYQYFNGWQTVFSDYQDFLPHVAEGIDIYARNELACLAESGDGSKDLTEAKSTFIHSVGALTGDAVVLQKKGASVVWSPRSNIALYGNTAQVSLYDTIGLNIALSSDWTPSGSMNLVRELKCASNFNKNHLNQHFNNYELWKMVTANAADALHVDDKIGRLKTGLYADISVYVNPGLSGGHKAIIDSTSDSTLLVLRGGKALYGDADIVAAVNPNCETMPSSIGQNKAVCIQQELGMNFPDLAGVNTGSYPLTYRSSLPKGEPTCTPSRPNEYTGKLTSSDPDGDGIPNASIKTDNCPYVFNPVRPVDNGKQPDFDGDGIGDVCDPKPLE